MQPAAAPSAGTKSRFPQYAAAVVANVLYLSYSMADTSRFEVAEELRNYTHLSGDAKREAVQRDMGLTFCLTGMLSFPVFGLMFEKFTRKVCAYVIGATYVAASVLLLFCTSYELFHVAQFFCAVSAAGTTVLSPIYISEVAQDEVRGALQALNVLVLNVGFLLASLAARFLPARSAAWLSLVPTAVAALCFRFWLPETPVYYLRRDDGAGAAKSLTWLRGAGADVAQEAENTRAVLKATRSDHATTTTVFQDFFQKRTLRFCAVVTALCLIDHFSGFTGTGYKLEDLLGQANAKHPAANDVIQYLVYIVGNVIVILICDRKGRKTAQLISTAVCALALVANGVCFHLMGADGGDGPDARHAHDVHDDHVGSDARDAPEVAFGATKVFALIFSLVHVMSYNIGIGVLSAVVIADIFPPKMLNTQLAINGIISWPFTYAVNDLFFRGVQGAILTSGALWVYAGCCAAGCCIIAKFLPETKSRPAGYLLMDNRDDVVLGRFQ